MLCIPRNSTSQSTMVGVTKQSCASRWKGGCLVTLTMVLCEVLFLGIHNINVKNWFFYLYLWDHFVTLTALCATSDFWEVLVFQCICFRYDSDFIRERGDLSSCSIRGVSVGFFDECCDRARLSTLYSFKVSLFLFAHVFLWLSLSFLRIPSAFYACTCTKSS